MNKLWRKINGKLKRTSGETRGVTTISTTYYGTDADLYIGVSSEKPVTVYLPAAAPDGKIIIIKAEMRPPLGSRKVNIATVDGSKIDGYSEASINVSHGYITLIRNNNEWYIIG